MPAARGALLLAQFLLLLGAVASTHDPSKFNEVWETASVEPGHGGGGSDSTPVLTVNGAQPLGNGDLTAAAFPELDTGRISMWLSKQDAIADDTSPFKLGQVSLAVQPNPRRRGLARARASSARRSTSARAPSPCSLAAPARRITS
jgi:hypothetical protein